MEPVLIERKNWIELSLDKSGRFRVERKNRDEKIDLTDDQKKNLLKGHFSLTEIVENRNQH